MARLFVEWRNRYHSDHPIPARLLESLKVWFRNAVVHQQGEGSLVVLSAWNDLLKSEPPDARASTIERFFESGEKRRRFLIPFLCEIKERKTPLVHRISLVLLGFKVVELTTKKFAGRDCTILKLFNKLRFKDVKSSAVDLS